MSIPGLPNPWLIVGVLLALAGAWMHGNHTGADRVRADWQAEVAEANEAARAEKARLDAEAAAKDRANAEHTRDMEVRHAQELEAVRNGRAAFVNELAGRLRDAEARCSRSVVPSAADSPGVSERGTPGTESGHRGPDIESADRLREIGKGLQLKLRECRAWALEHGR